jgi:hypothetical protein
VYDESDKAAMSPEAVGGGGGDLHRLQHELRDKLEIKSDKSSEGTQFAGITRAKVNIHILTQKALIVQTLTQGALQGSGSSTQFTCFTGTKVNVQILTQNALAAGERKLNALYTLMSIVRDGLLRKISSDSTFVYLSFHGRLPFLFCGYQTAYVIFTVLEPQDSVVIQRTSTFLDTLLEPHDTEALNNFRSFNGRLPFLMRKCGYL